VEFIRCYSATAQRGVTAGTPIAPRAEGCKGTWEEAKAFCDSLTVTVGEAADQQLEGVAPGTVVDDWRLAGSAGEAGSACGSGCSADFGHTWVELVTQSPTTRTPTVPGQTWAPTDSPTTRSPTLTPTQVPTASPTATRSPTIAGAYQKLQHCQPATNGLASCPESSNPLAAPGALYARAAIVNATCYDELADVTAGEPGEVEFIRCYSATAQRGVTAGTPIAPRAEGCKGTWEEAKAFCDSLTVTVGEAADQQLEGVAPGTVVDDWRLAGSAGEAGSACGSGCSADFGHTWVEFPSLVVSSTVSFFDLDISDFDDAAFRSSFAAAFAEDVALSAGVSTAAVQISSISPGSVQVASVVEFGSRAASASSFAASLEASPESIFTVTGPRYGDLRLISVVVVGGASSAPTTNVLATSTPTPSASSFVGVGTASGVAPAARSAGTAIVLALLVGVTGLGMAVRL